MGIASIFVVATIGYVGLSFIPKPIHATIVQNFTITVDQRFIPTGLPGTGLDTLPPVGTKGFGTLTFNEAQIQYNGKPQEMGASLPLGYYATTPTSYSLDFFNHHYTEVTQPSSSRHPAYFSFDRTDAGKYQLSGFAFGNQDETSRMTLVGQSVNGNFSYDNPASSAGVALGSLQFTDAKEVPEPETIAGVPIALAFGWSYRKLKRK